MPKVHYDKKPGIGPPARLNDREVLIDGDPIEFTTEVDSDPIEFTDPVAAFMEKLLRERGTGQTRGVKNFNLDGRETRFEVGDVVVLKRHMMGAEDGVQYMLRQLWSRDAVISAANGNVGTVEYCDIEHTRIQGFDLKLRLEEMPGQMYFEQLVHRLQMRLEHINDGEACTDRFLLELKNLSIREYRATPRNDGKVCINASYEELQTIVEFQAPRLCGFARRMGWEDPFKVLLSALGTEKCVVNVNFGGGLQVHNLDGMARVFRRAADAVASRGIGFKPSSHQIQVHSRATGKTKAHFMRHVYEIRTMSEGFDFRQSCRSRTLIHRLNNLKKDIETGVVKPRSLASSVGNFVQRLVFPEIYEIKKREEPCESHDMVEIVADGHRLYLESFAYKPPVFMRHVYELTSTDGDVCFDEAFSTNVAMHIDNIMLEVARGERSPASGLQAAETIIGRVADGNGLHVSFTGEKNPDRDYVLVRINGRHCWGDAFEFNQAAKDAWDKKMEAAEDVKLKVSFKDHSCPDDGCKLPGVWCDFQHRWPDAVDELKKRGVTLNVSRVMLESGEATAIARAPGLFENGISYEQASAGYKLYGQHPLMWCADGRDMGSADPALRDEVLSWARRWAPLTDGEKLSFFFRRSEHALQQKARSEDAQKARYAEALESIKPVSPEQAAIIICEGGISFVKLEDVKETFEQHMEPRGYTFCFNEEQYAEHGVAQVWSLGPGETERKPG